MEESYRKQCNIDDQIANIHIIDTSGHEDHLPLEENHMYGGDGFLIIFSLDLRSSFRHVSRLHQKILCVKGNDKAPIFILGNKSDNDTGRQVDSSGKLY